MSKKLKKAGVAIFTSKDFIIRVIVRKKQRNNDNIYYK